jgi:cell filamentation protein
MTERDPYVYPGTSVLKNKLAIQDAESLKKAEIAIVTAQYLKVFPEGQFDYTHLKTIHHHLFEPLYSWAGEERTGNIAKGHSFFALAHYIEPTLAKLFNNLKKEDWLRGLSQTDLGERLAYYFGEVNSVHPFREGNGRTNRAFFSLLAQQSGYRLDWEKVERPEYLEASIQSFNGNEKPLENMFKNLLLPIERHIQTQLTPLMLSTQTQSYLKEYVDLYLKETSPEKIKQSTPLLPLAEKILMQPDIVHWNKLHGISSTKLSMEQMKQSHEHFQKNSVSRQEIMGLIKHVDQLQKSHQRSRDKTQDRSQGIGY